MTYRRSHRYQHRIRAMLEGKARARMAREPVQRWQPPELRRRGVPEWDVKGLMGHTGGGVTEGYAKFDGDKVRKALDAWMTDLARDVPALRGVSSGSVKKKAGIAPASDDQSPRGLRVVGGTGFEPVTPTMSRSGKVKQNKH